ncbi:TPA: aldehyde dehydrogenase family protein [bacterium]|nr:aldehyde dehydrogenase family protein [bacterium]
MEDILKKQKTFFDSHSTLSYEFRRKQLIKLKELILSNEFKLIEAFQKDFNKSPFEVYSTETGLVIKEINYLIRNLKRFMTPKRATTSLVNFPSKGSLIYEPYGTVLIISPFNYPFHLTFLPLVGAIAAGNTVIVKPSSKTSNVLGVISEILANFDEEYIKVISKVDNLFDYKYDYIFFTGSSNVAKLIIEKQAKFLTPMTLELGGKSPCIVDIDADIELSAKRIVWGKFLNAGQTCIAPDYVLVHKEIKDKLISRLKYYINIFYYNEGVLSTTFTNIIDQANIERLKALIDEKKLIFGGKTIKKQLEPTILNNVTFEDKVMQQEIFGPILPLIEFEEFYDVINMLKNKPKPLALYYFSKDKVKQKYVQEHTSSGSVCINDVVMHVSEANLPFGGVGESGFGSYHGEKTFTTFSHQKSILNKSIRVDNTLRYPPYNLRSIRVVKRLFKL